MLSSLTCEHAPRHPQHSGSPGCAAHVEHAPAQGLPLASYPLGPGSEVGKVSSLPDTRTEGRAGRHVTDSHSHLAEDGLLKETGLFANLVRAELQKILQRKVGEKGQRCPQQLLGPGGHFSKKLWSQQSLCQSLLLLRPHFWAVIPDGSQAAESKGS